MRGDIPADTDAVWRSGNFVGDRRPIGRVTIRRPQMNLRTYALRSTFRRVSVMDVGVGSFNPYPQGIDPRRGESITNTYADYLWKPPEAPRELPNVANISWSRSTDADVAEVTIEFWNVEPLPIGEKPAKGEVDQQGFFTPGRGESAFSSRWGHKPNPWAKIIMPDNLLCTYEGYGSDAMGQQIGSEGWVPPERDSRMTQTGLWMIDSVQVSSSGRIVVKARDLARLLLDHMNFAPVVPDDFYPTYFKNWADKITVQEQREVIDESVNLERLAIAPTGSGNDNWPESAYNGASVFGHTHTHAFDNNESTYWLSVGNPKPTYRSAYEYLDFTVGGATVSEVRTRTVGAGYTVYVCVMVDGQWLPGPIMPYHRDGRGRYEEGMPYITMVGGDGSENYVLRFGPIERVQRIRVWYGNLRNFGLGGSKWRAGAYEVGAWGPVLRRSSRTVVDSTQVNLTPGPAGSNPGTCRDYTDVVKLFCAWAGLFWPADAFTLDSDGQRHDAGPRRYDSDVLGAGVNARVWGDFQQTGTSPPYEITSANFDKKSLLDGVAYLRETLGFLLHVDETGAVVWRMPNLWDLGNWISGMSPNPGRTKKILAIDETQVLMSLDATIQSGNVREGVFVANTAGSVAAMVGGYNPNPTGLRRVAGYCVDTETEIFTRRGWLRWDEVRPGDETLSIDESTGSSVWQAISDVAIFDAVPRDMVKFSANNFSAFTTSNHRWLVQTYSTTRKSWEWRWRTSETLGALDRIPRALPRADAPRVSTHSDDLVELVAWAYTDGSVKVGGRGRPRVAIYQDNLANPEKCERIRLSLKRLFGETGWSEVVRRGTAVVWTIGAEASATLLPHIGGVQKSPTMEFLTSLTQEQLELFIDVSIQADGWTRRTTTRSRVESRFFGQNPGPRLDAFEAACALAGVATSTHVQPAAGDRAAHGSVTLVDSQFYLPKATARPRAMEAVDHAGVVWCPTMPVHHTWLARRGGAVYFTGNTDQNFEDVKEARVMADLVAVRAMFRFRTDRVRIPAHPGIQIDDQVRIYERITSEGFVHYVKGISSSLDMATGRWEYTLQTHWLGDDPDTGRWVVNKSTLHSNTQQYVDALGSSMGARSGA